MPKATLGGLPLLGSSPVIWCLKEGVQPYIGYFDMVPEDAKRLLGQRVDLILQPDGGTPTVAKNLYVINILPGDNQYISKVAVADRRWLWSYAFVNRRYNMRRNVGTKLLVANDKVPAVNSTANSIAYWASSLHGGIPWDAESMLKDVLKGQKSGDGSVSDIERDWQGATFDVVIEPEIGQKIKALPIEELVIRDQGDLAINRVLQYLPEAGIYVDYDGTVVLYSKVSGKEKDLLKLLGPEIVGEGHADLVDNSILRPNKIEVYYVREVEVRHDFTENAFSSSTTTALGTSRILQNVLPSVDYQLPIGGNTICQGTYITVDQALTAWGNAPFFGASKPLDYSFILRAFVPGMDLWGILQLAGERPNANTAIAPWVARIGVLQNHFRQTFRLNPLWVDNSESIRAYRVGTIDPQSGQRGPALAYGDYCVLYTQASLWKAAGQGKPLDWAINRTAYPASGNLDSTAEPSPAKVTIVDSDQGIIHVHYKPDPVFGQNETILPSQVSLATMPTADISQRTRPIAFNSVIKSGSPPTLSASFKLSVVLTMVPSAPNNINQFQKVTVKPGDIASMLPTGQQTGLSNAKGPTMRVFIGPNREVARVAWNDAKAGEIAKIFGVGGDDPKVDNLVINLNDPSNIQSGASLNAIAKAEAAKIYGSLVDRYEGGMTGYINGSARPSGWIPSVSHELDTEGAMATTVEAPERVPQMPLWSFLDSNQRQAILKLAQPL